MKIITLSEEEFTWLRNYDKGRWAAIRIASHPEDLEKVGKQFNRQFENILYSYFTDITSPKEQDGKVFKPFSIENYNEIKEFVEANREVDILYIHCHAGICRSAGVGVGLKKENPEFELQHGLDGEQFVAPFPLIVSYYNPA